MLGLVLTAGGARGAYQAGVLKRIGELPSLADLDSPFEIVAGASAGALNGAMVASGAFDLAGATVRLADLWCGLEAKNVFSQDPLTLGCNAVHMLRDLTLGGILGRAGTRSLLDASPLRRYLVKHLELGGIDGAIKRGALYAFAVSATSYHSGRSFTFIQGRKGHPVWIKRRRVALSAEIGVDHILASAAIPIVFQPVLVETPAGPLYFGDGGLRLVTPFSPAIRLGATRTLAIGVRCEAAADDLSAHELLAEEVAEDEVSARHKPPLAQICGVFMNAIFLDHLDADLDHLERMNALVRQGNVAPTAEMPEPIGEVEALVVNPSEDIAEVAQANAHRMPRLVRYLLDGLGEPNVKSADLMSYLLFDKHYARELVDMGYRDAGERIDELETLLLAPRRPRRRAAPPVVALT